MNNKKYKHTLKICMIALLIFAMPLSTYGAETIVDKDETVYTMLDYNGTVQYTQVVNRLYQISDQETQDFSQFIKVNPLRPSTLLGEDNGALTWDTSDYIGKDFYYEGTTDAELPVLFEFAYTLDDQPINPKELGGKTGQLTLDMTITQNPNCQSSLQNIYMTQLQLLLNLDLVTVLDATNSTSTVAGKFINVTYTVLPSDSKSFQLTMDVKNFEMDPMSIALIKYDMSAAGDLSALTDGLTSANTGLIKLADGTTSLQKGLADTVAGFSLFTEGLLQLSSGATQLKSGLKTYRNGLIEFKTGTQTLSAGLTQTYEGLSDLNDGGNTLSTTFNQLSGGLSQLQKGHTELAALASSLLTSTDPSVVALAQGVLAENKALLELSFGLSQSAQGMTSFAGGLNELTGGLSQINQGTSRLPSGMDALISGFDTTYLAYSQIESGLVETSGGSQTFYNNITVLPSAAGELAEGQLDLSKGLTQMKEEVESTFSDQEDQPTYSFTNEAVQINSMQFVLKTPAIELPEEIEAKIVDTKKPVGLFGQFLERLKELL